MRRLVPFALVAISLLGVVALCPGPAQARTHACSRKGSTTVRSSKAIRIYDVDGGVFGCLYSRDKPYLLGVTDCQATALGDPGTFRLAGRYVGYSATTCNIDQAEDKVRVRDLRTGAKPVVVDASPTFRATPFEIGGYFVSDLELKSDGSVAWIVRLQAEGLPPTREVRKTDATVPSNGMPSLDRSVRLDSGEQIGSRSLALNGSSLSWTNAGMSRSASLG